MSKHIKQKIILLSLLFSLFGSISNVNNDYRKIKNENTILNAPRYKDSNNISNYGVYFIKKERIGASI